MKAPLPPAVSGELCAEEQVGAQAAGLPFLPCEGHFSARICHGAGAPASFPQNAPSRALCPYGSFL